MVSKPSVLIMAAAVALGALTGCTGKDQQTEPTAEATPEATATKSATPTPDEPTETPEAEDDDALGDDALPPGFPDPASLIGQVAHDEQAADGTWFTVVGDTPVPLVNTLSACFDGGSGDICGYAVSASVPPSGGTPQPATAALVLLLRSDAPLADGTPTWVVLDAIVTTSPGGEPAYLESCDGSNEVVIWAEVNDAPGDTIPVLAAWGPDASATSLVEVDPASLSCPWIGD